LALLDRRLPSRVLPGAARVEPRLTNGSVSCGGEPKEIQERRTKMKQETRSPLVTHLSWGRLEVEGWDGQFKDVKLFPGGAREWD
jgi:hypothetical protein